MASIQLTTELEAVNTMLDCINESPVSTLEVSGLVDVAKAKATLAEISRAVQEIGWHFNSETDYPLVRQADGKIVLPGNVLRLDTTADFSDYDITQRGASLYWKDERTYVFDKDIEVSIVFYLPWAELPEAARRYITVRASRIFQSRQLGSDTKHKFSEQEEFEARAALKTADINNSDNNMLSGSWSVASILDR